MSNGASFITGLGWENLLETLAQTLSYLLTDEETEYLIARFNDFQTRLKQYSR